MTTAQPNDVQAVLRGVARMVCFDILARATDRTRTSEKLPSLQGIPHRLAGTTLQWASTLVLPLKFLAALAASIPPLVGLILFRMPRPVLPSLMTYATLAPTPEPIIRGRMAVKLQQRKTVTALLAALHGRESTQNVGNGQVALRGNRK